MIHRSAAAFLGLCAWLGGWTGAARAQSTQGLITGRVLDSRNGAPLTAAAVTWTSKNTGESGSAVSDARGIYYLPNLSPGEYRVRVSADQYQPQELQELVLLVAARLELNFRLRPLSDVWEKGQYGSIFLPGTHLTLNFFGPDLDSTRSGSFDGYTGTSSALETSMSEVIDLKLISDLPLNGRDVYTALVLEPNVTSDQGTTRGIGVAVNGQRPSSSNFLLDGLENNNSLVSGPLTPVAPEEIQEYRFSTNNYSAEYGRTGGFIANAVTRSGGNQFHGLLYYYLKNDALNANEFQNNTNSIARLPDKELEAGFQAGGPISTRRGLFWSSSFEQFRSRTLDAAQTYYLPSPALVSGVVPGESPVTKSLLQSYPPPAVTPLAQFPLLGSISLQQPVSVDRSLALARVDYRHGNDNWFARVSILRLSRPDFIWSPYKQFTSGLADNATSSVLGYERAILPGLLNEARFGFNLENTGWNLAHPGVPKLVDQPGDEPTATLPGSPAFYSYQNDNRSGEFLDNLTWTHGRHLSTFGGGLMIRRTSGFLTLAGDGEYNFPDIADFSAGVPFFLIAAVTRFTNQTPNFNRDYATYPWYAFAQDTFKLTSRFVLNYGLRYEHDGAPRSLGAGDTTVTVRPGMTVWEENSLQLATGTHQLYRSDNADWAPRIGLSFDVTGKGNTILRGAYGIYYEHPFDNLWQTIRNNSIEVPNFYLEAPFNYLAPISSVVAGLKTSSSSFPELTMFDPNFKQGRIQSYFGGLQQRAFRDWVLEVNGTGSLGRHLITTDIINRNYTTSSVSGRLTGAITDDVDYRAPQGSSSYQALTGLLRHRFKQGQFQISYTWSHSIDNQSEPLDFDIFNLFFLSSTSGSPGSVASFTRQFDSSSDRGNSDFDQRQNLVFFSIWDLPSPHGAHLWRYALRDWHVSQLAAFRSGFPYTVFANGAFNPQDPVYGNLEHNRANLLSGATAYDPAVSSIPGGRELLNANAFGNPANEATVGTSGRNAFQGPGLISVDLSLSRTFALARLGEAGRLTIRADAFNVLNHANLGNPNSYYSGSSFGNALYGQQEQLAGFPSAFPLSETARQVQFLLRAEW